MSRLSVSDLMTAASAVAYTGQTDQEAWGSITRQLSRAMDEPIAEGRQAMQHALGGTRHIRLKQSRRFCVRTRCFARVLCISRAAALRAFS